MLGDAYPEDRDASVGIYPQTTFRQDVMIRSHYADVKLFKQAIIEKVVDIILEHPCRTTEHVRRKENRH